MAPTPKVNALVLPVGIALAARISLYSSSEWEAFTDEWMLGFKPAYAETQRLTGSGDMGRDVVGYHGPLASNPDWDNYQCKHYSRPLTPSDIWIELGKMCYYSWKKEFPAPRKYRFVAPKEVSPDVRELLKKPEALRSGLKANWNTCCRTKITKSETIELTRDFLAHVDAFDFSDYGYVPLVAMLEQHSRTCFWHQRFQIALPDRPEVEKPPVTPTAGEAGYVRQLLEVYSEREKASISTPEDLYSFTNHHAHFQRSRERFYSAESLHRFSRDNLKPGEFEKFKREIFDGVIDIVASEHPDGLRRLDAATDTAAKLAVAQSEIGKMAEVADKKGVCHHLANEGRLTWIPNDSLAG